MKDLNFVKSIIDGVEIKRCRRTPHSYKMHLHNELTIGYIEEGSTCVNLGDTNYNFNTGDGIIIPPLMSHMCSPDDISNWQTVILYVDPKYYKNHVAFNNAIKLTDNNAKRIKTFIDILDEETDKTYLENLLIELLLDFGEPIQKLELEESYTDSTTTKIQNFLINNFKEDIHLSALEERFGVNKFTIIRNFKRRYNTTPIAYQLQLKVAEAKNLLSAGKDVFDICNQVGFYDQAHFIREFKKMHGVTPNNYQGKITRTN